MLSQSISRKYIFMIRLLIEEYIRGRLRTHDLEWLSAQEFTNINIHELEQDYKGCKFKH